VDRPLGVLLHHERDRLCLLVGKRMGRGIGRGARGHQRRGKHRRAERECMLAGRRTRAELLRSWEGLLMVVNNRKTW